MTIYALCIATSIYFLSRYFNLTKLASYSASFWGLILVLPITYPSIGFDFLSGVPSDCILIFLDTIAIIMFIKINKHNVFYKNIAFFIIILLICLYELYQQPNFALVSLMPVGFFSIVSLFDIKNKKELYIKIVLGFIILLISALFFGQLLYALFGFAKPSFFMYEFYSIPQDIKNVSFFTSQTSRAPAWLTYSLAILGGVYGATKGAQNIRAISRGFLFFILVNISLILVTGRNWQGPRIAYIDIFIFPFYCMFAFYAIQQFVNYYNYLFKNIYNAKLLFIIIIYLCLGFFILNKSLFNPYSSEVNKIYNPFIWPPNKTQIIDFLINEIAIKPGQPFHGRLANITGSKYEKMWNNIPFLNQHNFARDVSLYSTGNDHQMYGFWYFGIPTLFESNQFSSPFFHLVNARLLNNENTLDTRSYEAQSLNNPRIMGLLGSSYLLSDSPVNNLNLVLKYKINNDYDFFLYRINNPNISGYSITKIKFEPDAKSVIDLLADPTFDVQNTAIITTQLNDIPVLIPANNSKLIIERGGYTVEADSNGTSMLLLPIEFSSCLSFIFEDLNYPQPKLLRADLTLTGIIFTGKLRGKLILKFDLFSSQCRLNDWDEAVKLKIADVKNWPMNISK